MIEAIVGDAPHEVAIVSYGEVPYLLGEFSDNSEAVRRALAKLKPCGAFHAATIDRGLLRHGYAQPPAKSLPPRDSAGQ
jgi:hypothetical protein